MSTSISELTDRQTGAVTYFYITEDGWLQPGMPNPVCCPRCADLPELEYTYDLQLPPTSDPAYLRPKPHDDEVESFAVRTVSLQACDRTKLTTSCFRCQRYLMPYTLGSSSLIAG
jgi:hypothetical protein